MQIEKILNNNVVQAMDNDVEYIVMGKGLGFQKKVGETVDKEKIEKIFVLENPEIEAEWTRAYVDLPDGEMQVFLNILTFAEAVLQTKFDPSFFIALADHAQLCERVLIELRVDPGIALLFGSGGFLAPAGAQHQQQRGGQNG